MGTRVLVDDLNIARVVPVLVDDLNIARVVPVLVVDDLNIARVVPVLVLVLVQMLVLALVGFVEPR